MVFKYRIMDEQGVERALRRMSHEIIERTGGCKDVLLMGIRRRGVPLANTIASNIKTFEGIDVPVYTLDITLYRDDIAVSDEPLVHIEKEGYALYLLTTCFIRAVPFARRLMPLCEWGVPRQYNLLCL